jgi:hypothetical protein
MSCPEVEIAGSLPIVNDESCDFFCEGEIDQYVLTMAEGDAIEIPPRSGRSQVRSAYLPLLLIYNKAVNKS